MTFGVRQAEMTMTVGCPAHILVLLSSVGVADGGHSSDYLVRLTH